jgi:hypothetical protein
LTAVDLYGASNVPAVKWVLGIKPANTVSTLRFKARLTSYPAGVDSVFNIAYAVMNGDTIPSTGNACDMAIITVDGPRANNDTVSVLRNTPLTIYVFANDEYPPFCTPALTIIDNSYNGLGVATVVSGQMLYTPIAGKSGIDSVLYQLDCDGRISMAKVYVILSNPLSLQYVACPGATVIMGFNAISGVTYRWYNAETGGTVVTNESFQDTLKITKGATNDIVVWWVEPQSGSFVFPRHRVELEQSQYCASTTAVGCSATGALLYKEDFGGNDKDVPQYSATTSYDEFIDLVFCPSCVCSVPTYGYCFAKTMSSSHAHLLKVGGGDDHTSWGDKTSGYFMMIDPAQDNLNYRLYGSKIKGLCTGTNLSFTLWAVDWHQGVVNEARPKIEMLIKDAFSGDTIVTSGTITLHRENPAEDHLVWRQYGFDFTLPDGVDSILFTIINKENAYGGNDWFLDDIEVRLCAPPITTNITGNDTIVCYDNALDIAGIYTEDCTFGNELAYRWEFRHADSSSWKTLESGIETVNCTTSPTITKTLSIASATKADEGYYRMFVSSAANIGSVNCRSASDSVYVRIVDKFVAPDIRLQISPSPPNRTVQLTSYLDSTDYNRVEWGQVSPYPVVSNTETGLIMDSYFHRNGTYTYQYTLLSPEYSGCGTTSARVYIRAQSDRILGRTIDTITICSALSVSRFVNLNQIFGLELGGVWTYPNDLDGIAQNNVTPFVSPSRYAGAMVFNAQKAYAEANINYNIVYRGIPAKKFDFVYTAGSATKRVTLIVTE